MSSFLIFSRFLSSFFSLLLFSFHAKALWPAFEEFRAFQEKCLLFFSLLFPHIGCNMRLAHMSCIKIQYNSCNMRLCYGIACHRLKSTNINFLTHLIYENRTSLTPNPMEKKVKK